MLNALARCLILIAPFVALYAAPAFAAKITYEELVSIGETSVGFGWQTDAPAPTTVFVGETPLEFEEYSLPGESTEHYIEIEGLAPDTLYAYAVGAPGDWRDEQPWWWSPGSFRTLARPEGAYLFSFATVNDTHIGEEAAGLIAIGDFSLTPGFSWDDPDNPYWKFTNEEAVAEINDSDALFVVHKGDVTDDAEDWEYEAALDIYGALDMEIFFARGNHDRVQHGEDYFKQILGIADTSYFFDEGPIRFVIVDSNDGNGSGHVTESQRQWLRGVLEDAQTQGLAAMLFAHHTFSPSNIINGMSGDDARAMVALVSEFDNVVAMFAGHSHRAAVLTERKTGALPYVETPATKEYPMGYTLYKVYEGGFTQTFHRASCEECLAWSSISRGEYFGYAPYLQLGMVAERNFSYAFPIVPDATHGTDDDDADDDLSEDDTDDDSAPHGSDDDDDEGCGC